MREVETELKDQIVEVCKAEDLRFKGAHPNGIFEGYSIRGTVVICEVGERMEVQGDIPNRWLSTSPVVSIEKIGDEGYRVQTLNSIYTINWLSSK